MQEQNTELMNYIHREINFSDGQNKIKCMYCKDDRKKHKSDRPLSVNVDQEKIVYNCFHCGTSGIIYKNQKERVSVKTNTKPLKKIVVDDNQVEGACADWLKNRGISAELAVRNGCILNTKNGKPVIGFSFKEGDKVTAIKWRVANGEKTFYWENNCKRLWGNNVKDSELDDIESTIVIVEGEIDQLSVKTAFANKFNIECYSVPNGAPSKVSNGKVDPQEDGRFKYVWNDQHLFKNKTKIILATDDDESGDALSDELSRRLKKARCYRANYNGFKDANELLLSENGAEKLRDAILDAEPIKLHGLNTIDFYHQEIQSLYDNGAPSGWSTGIKSVDKLFTIKTGMLNIVSGYPSEGKSAFVDMLIMNLARNYGIKTCYCSFENPVSLHSVKLAQIYTDKPFFRGVNTRMTQQEKDVAEGFIKDHVIFQDYQEQGMATIEQILEKAESAIHRMGCRVLVIDPFNFIQTDAKGRLETDVVSDMLTTVQTFIKQNGMVCFFVAHPSKPKMGDGKRKSIVGGVDISKSMAWFSKSDLGITVAREDDHVGIHCWKARWGIYGHKQGNVKLTFDPITGRYNEYEQPLDTFDWSLDGF